jgi:hypothetical protein
MQPVNNWCIPPSVRRLTRVPKWNSAFSLAGVSFSPRVYTAEIYTNDGRIGVADILLALIYVHIPFLQEFFAPIAIFIPAQRPGKIPGHLDCISLRMEKGPEHWLEHISHSRTRAGHTLYLGEHTYRFVLPVNFCSLITFCGDDMNQGGLTLPSNG